MNRRPVTLQSSTQYGVEGMQVIRRTPYVNRSSQRCETASAGAHISKQGSQFECLHVRSSTESLVEKGLLNNKTRKERKRKTLATLCKGRDKEWGDVPFASYKWMLLTRSCDLLLLCMYFVITPCSVQSQRAQCSHDVHSMRPEMGATKGGRLIVCRGPCCAYQRSGHRPGLSLLGSALARLQSTMQGIS